jgi:hypothetical protein
MSAFFWAERSNKKIRFAIILFQKNIIAIITTNNQGHGVA